MIVTPAAARTTIKISWAVSFLLTSLSFGCQDVLAITTHPLGVRPLPPIVMAEVQVPGCFADFKFLQPEAQENLITLTQQDTAVLVRIYNSGMFDPGSAKIKPAFNEVLIRISAAIAERKFKALVIGHTDNVWVPRNSRYGSNFGLSEARAKAVAAMLSEFTGPGVIMSEGRAANESIGDNATPEGREANRRIEILVYGAAEAAGLKPQ